MTAGRTPLTTPSDLPRWVCRECGYDGLRFGITKATVDVSVAVGCPACGGEMFRDDPLGQIEMGASA